MSIIRADSIKNRAGDGAPDFPNGITITGVVTATTLNSVSNNIDVDDFIEVGNNIKLGNAGVITATSGNFTGNVSIGGTLTYEDVTNIDSVGLITARDGVFIPDNKELKIGNTAGSPDLKIYHDTTTSIIQDNTGANLDLCGNRVNLVRGDRNTQMLAAIANGPVELYHNNALKLSTSTSGISVTGTVAATAFTGDGSALTGITQTTINSNADNRIITGSGTANTLNAEGSFTFDSGVADITGKLRIDVDSTSGAGSGGAEGIFLRNTNETDGNAVTIFAGADDYAAAASAINFINIDHSANTGAITFDTRKTGNVYAEKMRISSEGYVTKPLNVSFMVKADSNQAYSGGSIFVCNSPQTSGVCHNIGGHFNTSTGVFTAPVAGRYWLSMDTGPQFLSSSPTDGWQITIQKNGSDSEVASMLYAGGENGNEDHIRADGIFNLAANDEIRWRMNGYGGSMNFIGTKFQGYLLG